VVRVIEYVLRGHEESYRLVTNWLESDQAPAHAAIRQLMTQAAAGQYCG